MNKQQKIRRLTWKYFLEQKLEEVKVELGDIIGGTIVIAIFLVMIGLGSEGSWGKGLFLVWIGIVIVIFWILVEIIAILVKILKWIKSNWKKAKAKATMEMKNGNK